MKRDGLAPSLIMTTERTTASQVLQATTDAYAVTRVRDYRSSSKGETSKGDASLTTCQLAHILSADLPLSPA
jgi:hypothetical protein